MLYVKRAKFSIVKDSHGLTSVIDPKIAHKYSNITIADTKSGKPKRILFEEFKKLYLAGEPWTRHLLGVYYDKHNDRFTFAEVDPDDWKEYHAYYEEVDDKSTDAVKFCGGFSFRLNLYPNIDVSYKSDFDNNIHARVSNKGSYKNFVRLEKGFVIYNDEVYARKTNECEEVFCTADTCYEHKVVYHTETKSFYVRTHPSIESIKTLQDLAFACRYRHSKGDTVDSYFLVNDIEYDDFKFSTKFGWSVPADGSILTHVPRELATLKYKGKSYVVFETHQDSSTYIIVYDVDSADRLLLQDARMAMTTPTPIIIPHGTMMAPVRNNGFLSHYENNKIYFGYQDCTFEVLELEVIDEFGVIRCVPRYKKTSEGVYDLLYGKIKPEGIDFDEQKKALGLDALGSFDIEDYKAYIQSQSAYIRQEILKCKLADSELNIWLLREINRLPATDLYFRFAPHEGASGLTLWVSKDGKHYTDIMRFNTFANKEYICPKNNKTYLALRLSSSGEAQVGIALVYANELLFYRLEYLFDVMDIFDEHFTDTYGVINNNDILKELENGYIRGNLL